MAPKTTTVAEYLAALPEDRRRVIKALRTVIRKNIDKPFKESIEGGALAYTLPHSVYPDGYHCNPEQPLPFAGVASQKNHIGLYLFCIYCGADGPELFRKQWLASGKKLDMGKSCVRVRKLEDIPLDVVGRAIKRITAKKFVAAYEAALPASARKKSARHKAGLEQPARKRSVRAKAVSKQGTRKQTASKRVVAKKAVAKKAVAKKAVAKKVVAKKVVAKKAVAKKVVRKKTARRG